MLREIKQDKPSMTFSIRKYFYGVNPNRQYKFYKNYYIKFDGNNFILTYFDHEIQKIKIPNKIDGEEKCYFRKCNEKAVYHGHCNVHKEFITYYSLNILESYVNFCIEKHCFVFMELKELKIIFLH